MGRTFPLQGKAVGGVSRIFGGGVRGRVAAHHLRGIDAGLPVTAELFQVIENGEVEFLDAFAHGIAGIGELGAGRCKSGTLKQIYFFESFQGQQIGRLGFCKRSGLQNRFGG